MRFSVCSAIQREQGSPQTSVRKSGERDSPWPLGFHPLPGNWRNPLCKGDPTRTPRMWVGTMRHAYMARALRPEYPPVAARQLCPLHPHSRRSHCEHNDTGSRCCLSLANETKAAPSERTASGTRGGLLTPRGQVPSTGHSEPHAAGAGGFPRCPRGLGGTLCTQKGPLSRVTVQKLEQVTMYRKPT